MPRIYLGATQYIEYDGYWHVFIAMQENWEIFWREYQANFHPPLYYLLLKLSLWFGRSALVYRAVSILAGVGAVFVIGKIAGKLSLWRPTPALAALAYGLSQPAIIISNEVRSYMLCVFFMLASFYYFLDIFDGHTHAKSRIAFAIFAICATASHYSAFFYVFACVAIAAAFRILSFRQIFRRRLVVDLRTFVPVGAFVALLYYTHARSHAAVAEHLTDFYFQPGGESLTAFLFRNGQNLFNSFSPVSAGTPGQFVIVLSALIVAAGCMVYVLRRPQPENTRAAAAALAGILILGSIIAGAIFGKYPFGGLLRQQFILFPFAVISGCILLDRPANAIRDRRLNVTLMVSAALVIAGVSILQFYRFPKIRTEVGTENMRRFREMFSSPAAVYVDQFSLIMFFIHHHDWNWQFSGKNLAVPTIDIYRVSRGTDQFILVRDKGRWTADLQDSAFYGDLAAVIHSERLPSITTFHVPQFPESVNDHTDSTFPNRISELASAANLCVKKQDFMGGSWGTYNELTSGQCPPEADDTNSRVDYSGSWTRGVSTGARSGTLTYTNETGASARLTFNGTEVQYVYTKAFNRGMAEVLIDGIARSVVDLYGPDIEWQASAMFQGLTPGWHTIEIRASGGKNPASADVLIDLDAIVAPLGAEPAKF
ncbi:MAG: hypothetical protein HY646_06745 [Acidobacteria bacterium]|nr:hypothetical protein [Acidobacteriota bacterium]